MFIVLDPQSQRKIRDDLKAEALRLPHNHRGMCIVTGTQRTGSDEDRNGTTEVRWIYPPWSNDHVSHIPSSHQTFCVAHHRHSRIQVLRTAQNHHRPRRIGTIKADWKSPTIWL